MKKFFNKQKNQSLLRIVEYPKEVTEPAGTPEKKVPSNNTREEIAVTDVQVHSKRRSYSPIVYNRRSPLVMGK